MPTTCVWLDGLASNTTEQFLTRHFCRYGHVVKVCVFSFLPLINHCSIFGNSRQCFPRFPQVVFDRMKGMALILYNNIEYAQAAVKDTKGWKIGGSKIKVTKTNELKPKIWCLSNCLYNLYFYIFFVQVDFANQESQMAFYRSMQASGQDIRDFYDILSERRLVTICLSNV